LEEAGPYEILGEKLCKIVLSLHYPLQHLSPPVPTTFWTCLFRYLSCLPPYSLSYLPCISPLYFSIVYSSTPRREAEVFPDCGELVTKLHIITSQITVISQKKVSAFPYITAISCIYKKIQNKNKKDQKFMDMDFASMTRECWKTVLLWRKHLTFWHTIGIPCTLMHSDQCIYS